MYAECFANPTILPTIGTFECTAVMINSTGTPEAGEIPIDNFIIQGGLPLAPDFTNTLYTVQTAEDFYPKRNTVHFRIPFQYHAGNAVRVGFEITALSRTTSSVISTNWLEADIQVDSETGTASDNDINGIFSEVTDMFIAWNNFKATPVNATTDIWVALSARWSTTSAVDSSQVYWSSIEVNVSLANPTGSITPI